jgi:ABC-type polysaccharide/polyol phosphate export permease
VVNRGGIARLLREPPPYAGRDEDEGRMLARWALWDIVEGLRLRDMWLRQAWNEIRRRYKRTLLGPMWVTVSLVIFALMLSFVWSGLFNQQVTQFLPFLLSGLLPWTLISVCIAEGCMGLAAGEGLMKSRQFPYTTLIYGLLARNVILFGHNLIGYVPIALLCGVPLTWNTLLLFPGLVLVVVNCGWIAMLVAIFCLRYRDFQPLVGSLIQIMMFVTPVFWSASQLQGKRAMIVDVNILHHLVELVRQPLLGKTPATMSYIVCSVIAVAGWMLTYSFYARKRHRLAYWF